MKKTVLMILAVSAGLMIGGCGQKDAAQETATEAQTPAQEEVNAAVNTTHAYICPMNCENSARMEAGQCVVCGMDLVQNPNYAGAATTDTTAAAADGHEGHDHSHEGHDHDH